MGPSMLTFKQFLTEGTLKSDLMDITPAGKLAGRRELAKFIGLSDAKLAEVGRLFTTATATNLKTAYEKFYSAHKDVITALNSVDRDNFGPGEVALYFIFNNVGIGGKNSPIDVFLNGKPFAEAKKGDAQGPDALVNFKITKDGDKAVTQLLADLDAFNATYSDITGEDLPEWRSAGSLKVTTLEKWADIDLKKLASGATGGSKKPIDLVLKKDGDLVLQKNDEVITNVKKKKTVEPIKNLIDGEGKVAVDDKISTLDKIIKRWADQAYEDYVDGKKFVLFDDKLRIRHFGELTKDMLSIYNTNRNQPYAKILFSSKPADEKGKK